MIYLKKGQKLADNPSMVVYDQTGYYNDGDSIICASAFSPDEPVCRYEAKFVAYGGMVYSISNQDELLTEITKIDPKSLFGKDSQQVAVNKIIENIVPQAEGVVPVEETKAIDEVIDEKKVTTENITATTTPTTISSTNNNLSTTTQSNISTTTPNLNSTTTPNTSINNDISTTTPDFSIDNNTSTSTPPEILFVDSNISTTTPEVSIPVETPDNTATSSDTTIIENNPTIIVPPILETPTNTSTTTEEVVAFAKKIVKNKISKSLGL